jgi:DNA-binding XRE family transcriptional regulator
VDHRKADVREMAGFGAAGDDEARFLRELRQLRDGAGLGQAELAARAHYPYDSIRAAEIGPDLPDLPVLAAYVKGCGGTTEEWEERWRSLTRSPSLPVPAARHVGHSPAASAGARIGLTALEAETPDPSVIIAALNRVAEDMASGSGDPLPDPAEVTSWSSLPPEASPAASPPPVELAPEPGDPPAGWDPIRVSSAWPVLPLSAGGTEPVSGVSPVPAAAWEQAPWDSAPASWANDPAGSTTRTSLPEAPAAGSANTNFTPESRPAVPATPAPSAPPLRGAVPAASTEPERASGASRTRVVVVCAVLLCVIAVALALFV